VVLDLGRSGPAEGKVRMSRPDLVYVEFVGGLVVAIEHASAPRTPTGVYVVDETDLSSWAVGSTVHIDAGSLAGPGLMLAWDDHAAVYDGTVGPLPSSPELFVRALTRVLGVRLGDDCPVCALAGGKELWSRPGVRHALHALARRAPGSPLEASNLELLLGLGAGLTPESDDLIVGALLAQRALGVVVDDVLGVEELTRRVSATTALSGTWLRAAAAGRAVEPLRALLGGDPLSEEWETEAERLLAVGSSTGRSMMTGATLGMVGATRGPAVRTCRHEMGRGGEDERSAR
jgi:hypothetical protein